MMSKKGMISMHPGYFFVFGLIIGAVLVYYLVSKGMLSKTLLPI